MGIYMFKLTKRIYDDLTPPVEEAFRVLSTNIKFCSLEKKTKTVTVVSHKTKEGKTTVAINLAITIARSGSKVLLVDADLRKPSTVKRLGEVENTGLSSFLLGEESLEDVICNTSIDRLHYISCGIKPTNPSELIGSKGFAEFLSSVEEIFDMIIIDTSSLGSVIDGAIIASYTDGTLIVVESGTLHAKTAIRLEKQLKTANARILGVVINKVSKRDYKAQNRDYNNLIYFKNPIDPRKLKNKAKILKQKNEVMHSD